MKQLLNVCVLFLNLVMKLIGFVRLLGRQMGLTVVRYKIEGRCLVSIGCPFDLVTKVLKIKVNIFKHGRFRI